MSKAKSKTQAGLIALIAFGLSVCPQAWGGDLRLQTAFAQQPFPTVPPIQVTLLPPIGTIGAIPTPIPTVGSVASPIPRVSIEQGSFWSPMYERVGCGVIDDDLCFEICYTGSCFTYGNDDDRVTRFIDKVDDREKKIRELEILRAERGGTFFDSLGQCLEAGAGAGLAYAAIVGLTAPEPTISKILGGIAAGGAMIACGGSIYSTWRVEGLKQQIKVDEIIDVSHEAINEFQDLQENPPERGDQ